MKSETITYLLDDDGQLCGSIAIRDGSPTILWRTGRRLGSENLNLRIPTPLLKAFDAAMSRDPHPTIRTRSARIRQLIAGYIARHVESTRR